MSGSDAGAPTLIAGHLHPGMLFLRALDALRQTLLLVLLGLLTRQPTFIHVALALFVLGMAHALARYVTFRYRLTTEELITTEGILHRQERRIPLNRIQDLSFESTIVRRLFGLVVVAVETASGQGTEARLDSLRRADAEQLRAALLRARGRGAVATAEPETLLFESSTGELSLLGLTNNRVGAILLALLGLFELADQLGLLVIASHPLGILFERVLALHWSLGMIAAFSLLLAVLLAGWLLSVVSSLVLFHGFRLTLRDEVLLRRHGLLTARAQALPRRKIQRVVIEQTWLRRLLGVALLRADSAGSGMAPGEGAGAGRDVVVPLCQLPIAGRLVPALLPGASLAARVWRRVSALVIPRVGAKGLIWALLLAVAGWLWLGPIAAGTFVLVPIAFACGLGLYDNLAYARDDEHLLMRFGIFGRYVAVLPLRKVQGVVLRAGPIERLLGLASVTVYVAGGSPTRLSDLPRREAERLQRELARDAAAQRFVW
jgi:putative membrane protein